MKLTYASNKIKKLCDSHNKASGKHGVEAADALSHRLQQLESASSLQDIARLGRRPYGPHLHWLKGDKAGILSIDVTKKLRLLFFPADNSLREFSEISSIVIKSLGDTHK